MNNGVSAENEHSGEGRDQDLESRQRGSAPSKYLGTYELYNFGQVS